MPYGVTPQMMEAYGQTIFDLSLNIQVRRGDPVRNLNADAWQTQRDETGLTDPEIAKRIGLAVPQVTFIRCATERRLFRLNQYRKLYRLGGGLRYREDRYVDPEEPFEYSPDAALLRRSIRFEASEVRKYIDAGWWTAETLVDQIDRADPDNPAFIDQSDTLTFGQLKEQMEERAYALRGQNIGKGDVVAACLPTLNGEFIVSYLAVASIGAIFQPLDPSMPGQDIAQLVRHSRARLVIVGDAPDNPALAEELKRLESFTVLSGGELADLSADRDNIRIYPPVAADPVLLLSSIAEDGRPKIAPLTQQNLVSNVNLMGGNLEIASSDTVGVDLSRIGPSSLFGLHLALRSGIALSPTDKAGVAIANTEDGRLEFTRADGSKIGLWGTPETQILLLDGQPLEGVEARIVSDDGELLPPGEDGHLQVRGPSVCSGYFDNFVANKSAFTADAWFRTGRHARLNKDFKIEFSGPSGK